MRSHSSTACRKSSDVFSNSPARRPGSAEYIGIRQPVEHAKLKPATAAKISLRIAPFLPEMPRPAIVAETNANILPPDRFGARTREPHQSVKVICVL